MTTKVATAIAAGSAEAAVKQLAQEVRAKLGGERPVFLCVFASTSQPLRQVAHLMAAEFPGVTLIGASTAGEFTEARELKGSVSLFALAGDCRVHASMGLGLKVDPEATLQRALEGMPSAINGFPHRTAVLLLDPLAGNGEEATLLAASLIGSDVRLAGGAAGDDLKMHETLVCCGDRAASDGAVVAFIFSKKPLGVGVCHGHVPISDPLRVTRAEGNVVHEIDGRPAFCVWQERTREHARRAGVDVDTMPREAEGGYFLRYEAGLTAGANDYKMRAPLSRDGSSISFACGIPQGAIIRITESIPSRQVDSARLAAKRARAGIEGKVAGALVFDCICRNLILGDEFLTAVRGMSEELGDAPLAGFETYGEIALEVGDMSGFHNTTSVVLAFPQ